MPHITCPCGHYISLSAFPNENVFHLFSDWQLEDVQEAIVARFRGLNEDLRGRVANEVLVSGRSPNPEFVECSACGRLALFRSSADDSVVWYSPEVGNDSQPARIRNIFAEGQTHR